MENGEDVNATVAYLEDKKKLIDALKVENLKLKRYLKGMVKTLQNNMEVPLTNLGGLDSETLVITKIKKFNMDYLNFQTVSVNTTEEIK